MHHPPCSTLPLTQAKAAFQGRITSRWATRRAVACTPK